MKWTGFGWYCIPWCYQYEVRARRHHYEQKLKKDKEDVIRAKESNWQRQLRKQEQTKVLYSAADHVSSSHCTKNMVELIKV